MSLLKMQPFLVALLFICITMISSCSASAPASPQTMSSDFKAYRKLLHSHRSFHVQHEKVMKLWETVTGTVYEEKKPSQFIPTALPSSYHGQMEEDTVASPETLSYDQGSHNQNVLQDEKRLVPGGPDPLHHTSQPITP